MGWKCEVDGGATRTGAEDDIRLNGVAPRRETSNEVTSRGILSGSSVRQGIKVANSDYVVVRGSV